MLLRYTFNIEKKSIEDVTSALENALHQKKTILSIDEATTLDEEEIFLYGDNYLESLSNDFVSFF